MKNILLTGICLLALCATQVRGADQGPKTSDASLNKQTVQAYMEGFRKSDHAAILACLTDDVEWVMPGAFHLKGKAAFDGEIENPAFVGKPAIEITRLTEENNVVVAEGSVQATRKAGSPLKAVFCDVFEMQDGKVRRLISYLMEIKQAP